MSNALPPSSTTPTHELLDMQAPTGCEDCGGGHALHRSQHVCARPLEVYGSERSLEEVKAAPEGGMSERKRSADDAPLAPPDDALTRSWSKGAANDNAAPASVSHKKSKQNHKRRVSFCKTAKPPSDLLPANDHRPPLAAFPSLPSVVMNHSVSCTSIPSLSSSSTDRDVELVCEVPTDELDLTVSPAAFVRTIVLQSRSLTGSLSGEDVLASAAQRVQDDLYFLTYSEDHLASYTTDKVDAVQSNDVPALRALWKAGHLMQASNRFGESLLHTSCRRGHLDVVSFFIDEAGVSPRVRDDMGRTPLHDACWSSAPPCHGIMKAIVREAPELLLSRDKRGHSPFDYARREHWPSWVAFLHEHRQFIVNALVSTCRQGLGEDADAGDYCGDACGGMRTVGDVTGQ
ncbi:hypothetical protein ACHAWF_004608 [Thalassiosira exigua]